MSDTYLRYHPQFKANVLPFCLTPTSYKLRIPRDCKYDPYTDFGSNQLAQLWFWRPNKSSSSKFNSNFPNQLNITNLITNTNEIFNSPSVIDIHHETYHVYLPTNYV